jgi:UDP-galactopyranose mutase
LLSRIARNRPVYFVEEPVFDDVVPGASLDITENGGVVVVTPVLPSRSDQVDGFGPANNPVIRSVLANLLSGDPFRSGAAIWYYTPMALGALPGMVRADIVVFDAMDELANFHGAPKDLRDREALLLRTADLVFAGGPSLYEQRKPYNPMTFDFPSGVDAEHFRPHNRACPADLASVEGPVVGFYGVLDERIDFELLDSLATMRADWTIALIGPVVKIDERSLPQRDNLRYFGMRTYAELPAYLEHFDAAILPFAINDATRFISPTKTLEYLAGRKPVVSTPIRDVMHLYGGVVDIASTAADFVDAIERAWKQPETERSDWSRRVDDVLTLHAWDSIASRMEALIETALDAKQPTQWSASTQAAGRVRARSHSVAHMAEAGE